MSGRKAVRESLRGCSSAQSVVRRTRGGQGCSRSNRLPARNGHRRPRRIVDRRGRQQFDRFEQGQLRFRRRRIAPGWLRPPARNHKPESLRRRIMAPAPSVQARSVATVPVSSCLSGVVLGLGDSREEEIAPTAPRHGGSPASRQQLVRCDGSNATPRACVCPPLRSVVVGLTNQEQRGVISRVRAQLGVTHRVRLSAAGGAWRR